MPLDLNETHTLFALDAMRAAAALSRRIQQESGGLGLTKADLSPVTVADFAVQAVVARALGRSFPGATLVGEEDSEALRGDAGAQVLEAVRGFVGTVHPGATGSEVCDWIDAGTGEAAGAFWTLDPIDGTKGFLRGEQYATALALVEDGRVVFGALACPNLEFDDGRGVIMIAKRGEGAWLISGDGRQSPLTVSAVADATQTRLLRSVESGHTNLSQIDRIVERAGITPAPVPMDSQAKYAMLAAGRGDAMLRLLSPGKESYKERIWDQAAGSIVVEEAGGRVSDLEGRPLDFGHGKTLAANTGVCASNGLVHEALLEAVRATSPG